MKKVFFFIFVLTFLAIPIPLYATDYYVRTDGSDTECDGTQNEAAGDGTCAWETIDHCADSVSAGDTCRVQAGTYEERVSPGVEGTGSSNMVTFVADGSVTLCGFDIGAGTDYLRIVGFTMDFDYGACSSSVRAVSIASGVNVGLEFWNNTIIGGNPHCIGQPGWPSATNYQSKMIAVGNDLSYASNGTGSGIAISVPCNDCLIAYNEVHHCFPDAFYSWGQGTRFLNNYTHDLSESEGGHSDLFQNGSNYWGWQQSLFEATFQVGMGNTGDEHTFMIQNYQGGYCVGSCDTFEHNIIRRNVFHNVSSGTISLNQHSEADLINIYIYHNTTATSEANYSGSSYHSDYWIYNGGFSDINIFNNIHYEGWASDLTSGIRVWCLSTDTGCSNSTFHAADFNLSYDPDQTVTFTTPWTGQSNEQSNSNPSFTNYAGDDFTIPNSGGAYGNAGPLTTTSGSGTGTTFNVATNGGGFFRGDNTSIDQYGGNLVVGDIITVGTDTVRISSISTDAITVTESFTWADSENVYFGDDTTPDIGAFPYKSGGYSLSATYVLSAGTVTVTPNDANLVRLVIVYEDGIPVGADSISPYSVSGVGSGTLDVRVYPMFASKTLWATASESGSASPKPILKGSGNAWRFNGKKWTLE